MYTTPACLSIHLKLTEATYRTYARSCLETPDGQTTTGCSGWVFLSYPDTWDTLSINVPDGTRWRLEMYSEGSETTSFFLAY
jgi:hypothetical protein